MTQTPDHCPICGCDLHDGVCPEECYPITKESFSKLLPEGWSLFHYDVAESRDEEDIIEVVRGTTMLTLTQASDENHTILEACLYEGDALTPGRNYEYLDTLMGEYSCPDELETGEAQAWFLRVVRSYAKTGRFN